METTWNHKPSSRGHHRHPSFSSTLLDHIYRSIDDDSPRKDHHHHHRQDSFYNEHVISPDSRRRRSMADDFDRSRRTTTTMMSSDSYGLRYPNSCYSDLTGFSKTSASSSPPPPIRHIRTSIDQKPPNNNNKQQNIGSFLRKKSKALKIYTDLKKPKQPISPGGKLAAFLNSLFTTASTNSKKQNKTEPQYSSSSATCSTASSFSRSCMSKTPSSCTSSEKSKRSVRFCPINVILDEDYGHRRVTEEESRRRVMEAAKNVLRNYQKENKNEDDDDDDDEDDLFELENLSAIGEELPVYETTRVDTNRAIASRLFL